MIIYLNRILILLYNYYKIIYNFLKFKLKHAVNHSFDSFKLSNTKKRFLFNKKKIFDNNTKNESPQIFVPNVS